MCYQCGRKGNYARVCFTRFQAARPIGSKQVTCLKRKSNRKQVRDHERMDKFKQKRKVLQEMPFSNIRNLAFINSVDTTHCLKTEIQKMKRKLNKERTKSDEEIGELKEKLRFKDEETFKYKEVRRTFQDQVHICETINRQLREKLEKNPTSNDFEIVKCRLNQALNENQRLSNELRAAKQHSIVGLTQPNRGNNPRNRHNQWNHHQPMHSRQNVYSSEDIKDKMKE
ncbi:unnamed protein product [Mytilus coruscus]|uniref:CCHC-type domain-containing protein n=1 Tax=Mytilus coruscus TaxID=42192 RepID=A0A6J8CLZ7_MYTCO|nr:unnamed protein product [Mytilus coruscus]